MKTLMKVVLFLLLFSLLPLAGSVEAARIDPPFREDRPIFIQTPNLTATKTADATFDVTYIWDLSKVGDQTYLELMPGQTFTVNYDVTAWVVDIIQTDAVVSGTITVYNNGGMTPYITSVEDSLPGAVVTCDMVLPAYLHPGHTLTCTYTATVTGEIPAMNYVYVYRQVDPYGNVGLAATGEAPIIQHPATFVDDCVEVTDDQYGYLGTVCAGEVTSFVFEYTLDVFGGECGLTQFPNIATLTTDDTQTVLTDNWVVDVYVNCDGGCSLTIGYWKTHSIYGPAPYDDTWALVGEDTQFFNNVGVSWYQIAWMPPAGGNAYIILAQQYIAAYLNGLNGADQSAILDELAEAEYWLSYYNWNSYIPKADRAIIKVLADILDQYNNGYIGPGHCSE